ncbi:MAG: FG-GAP-like repeat-containing protein, partial [Pyrinomonadaceae bacterium]
MKNALIILTVITFAALAGNVWNAPVVAAQENSPETISVAASGRGNPFVNFTDGKPLASDADNLSARGANAPSALASADFDADGTDDLAIAYKTASGGLISIRRGNVESIFPKNQDAPPSPFLPVSLSSHLGFTPDFLAAGDFNADGRADLLAAKRGADNLILLKGDGDGRFAAPQTIELKGNLTAFATGEMNNFDNLADVAVGVTEKNKSKILIFQNRAGAFSAEPEVVKTSKPANALAFGEVDAHASRDLIAASGDELVFVSGSVGGKIEKENVSRRKVDFQIANLAIGDFAGEAENEIALLSKDGELYLSEPSAVADGLSRNARNLFVKVPMPGVQPPATAGGSDLLLAAKVSTRQKTDLIIVGANNLSLVTSDDANNLSLAATFDALENPIAVLPMRLNKDALSDLVVLTENNAEPSILMTAPTEVITVNNAGSGGGGGGTTLSNAIQTANNTPGLQEIQFNISGNIPIQMQVALPAITDPIVLNGLSQSNQNGEPLVSISIDPNFPTDGPTLEIVGGSSVVRGFILNGTGIGNPIRLRNGGNNFVESSFIGTNLDGTEPGATTASGVDISDSSANTIGGSTAQARNVISGVGGFGGADSHGVQISGAASNNLIKGNYIGVAKTGLQVLGNGGSGVFINTAASGNRVGGSTDGERNVISGNGGNGVKISLPTNSFSNALVENNFIGTNKNGDVALGNAAGGVRLEYATGSSTPTAAAQVFDNVISGNTGDGIYAFNSGTSLELNATPAFGVTPSGGEKKPTKVGTPNDVNAAPEASVVFLVDIARRPPGNLNGAANANAVAAGTGNRIGTNAAGTAALANTGNGVRLNNFPSRIEGNVISANGISGIRSTGATPFGNFIADNFIGTNAAGTAALGNANKGIWMDSANFPTVETQATKIYDNTISGNTGDGVFASVTTATNFTENNAAPEVGALFYVDLGRRPPTNLNGATNANAVVPGTGNRIGTNAAGTAALPNTGNGVNLQNAPAKIEGSIISANGANGIKSNLQPSATRFSQIADNHIGTDASGNNDLGNTADGINLEFNGTAPTTVEASKIWNNVISGNNGDGVEVAAQNVVFSGFNSAAPETSTFFLIDVAARRPSNFNAASPEIAPTGNRIGTNAAGTAAVPNNGNGILLTNAPALVEGNLISGNGANGIKAKAPASATLFNQIADNYIGTDLNGNADLGNATDGITFEVPTNGTRPATSRIWSNVVSGNNGDGVRVFRNANFTENAAPAFGVPPSGGEKKLTKVGTPNNENAAPQVAALFVVDMAARRPGNLNVAPGDAPAGNKIGTNAAGTAALGNSGSGVSITNVTTNIGGA